MKDVGDSKVKKSVCVCKRLGATHTTLEACSTQQLQQEQQQGSRIA